MRKSIVIGVLLMVASLIAYAATLEGYKDAKWGQTVEEVGKALSVNLERKNENELFYFEDHLNEVFWEDLKVPKVTPYPGFWRFKEGIFPEEEITMYKTGDDYSTFYKNRFFIYSIHLHAKEFSNHLKTLRSKYGTPKIKKVTYWTGQGRVQVTKEAAPSVANQKWVFTVHSWKKDKTLVRLIKQEWLSVGYPEVEINLYLAYISSDLYGELRDEIKGKVASANASAEERERKRKEEENRKIQ